MQPRSRFTHPASIAAATAAALALLIALVLTLAPTVQAAAEPAAAAKSPPTSARINSCVSAASYDNRRIEFSGRMQAMSGVTGGKLQMRFDVLRRYNESKRFRLLHAAGLGDWLSNTEPTATVYVRNIALSQIETAAHYKARVRYRWVDADGKVLAKKLRTTKVCKQTAPLPDPRTLLITKYPNPGQPTTTYVVRVFNYSRSEAINLPVSLAIDGQTPATKTIDSISGKESVDVTFSDMPVCTTEKYARIDPFNVVRQRSEAHNDSRQSC
ncbi:MAG: CARDB domain-containing protein [Solirubrobacterales bacterium]